MIDYNFYIIHWFINPILYLVFSRLILGPIRILSMPMMFILSYFLFIYIQALNIYINDIRNMEYLISVWAIPYIFLFTVFLVKDIILKHDVQKMKFALNHYTVSSIDNLVTKFSPLISFSMLLIVVTYIADKGISNISIISLITNSGNAVDVMNLRISGLNSNIHPFLTTLYSYSRSLFYPLYGSILMVLYLNKKIKLLHFIIVIGSGFFFCIATSAKAPLAIFLACIFLTFFFVKKIRISTLFFIGIIILLLPSFVYPLLYGAYGISALYVALESLWRRITWVTSQTTALYFDIFPEVFTHLEFSSNRLLAFITNQEYQSAANLVYNEYYETTIEGGLVNTSYVGSFYADWGLVGVLFSTILLGGIITILQLFYDTNNSNRISIAFKSVTIIAIPQLMLTNFYSVILGRGLILTSIIFLCLLFFSKFLVKSNESEII